MNAPIDTEQLLSAYADGELDAAERAQVDALLARDPVLEARLADHAALSAALRSHLRHAADEVDFGGFADAVLERLPPPRVGLRQRLRAFLAPLFEQRRYRLALGAAAMAALALVATPFFLGGGNGAGAIPPGLLLAGGPTSADVISVTATGRHDTMLFKTQAGTTIIYVQETR